MKRLVIIFCIRSRFKNDSKFKLSQRLARSPGICFGGVDPEGDDVV